MAEIIGNCILIVFAIGFIGHYIYKETTHVTEAHLTTDKEPAQGQPGTTGVLCTKVRGKVPVDACMDVVWDGRVFREVK